MNKNKITGKEKISELMNNEKAVEVLFEEGIHCIGCHIAPFETLEQGLIAHGKTKKEIVEILGKINRK